MSFKIAHCPEFALPLPDGHRFPMAKYELLPKKLIADGIAMPEQFFTPKMASVNEILTTHTVEYWHALDNLTLSPKDCRKIGLPMSKSLIDRERLVVGATIECANYALTDGISLSTSGGTHHAFADSGEGFCILNDICVASNVLLAREQARRILSVDLDVHQGNGNASIMANNPNVFVFSMHGKKNYPFIKPPSDLDIEFDDGTGDDEYLSVLADTLPRVIDEFCPDFIFYQAGVDVLTTDKLGKLSLSMRGCHERDEMVLTTAHRYGIPVAVVMGGGYSDDVDTVVEGHCGVFRVARGIVGG